MLKGNCAQSFVQRTTDVTKNLLSLHQLQKAGAFIFPALAMIHASVQGLEKSILQIYQFRQTQLLAKKRRKLLVHKDIMEGAAEQIPV